MILPEQESEHLMIRSCQHAVCALLLFVSGCASVATGISQDVTVNSMPPGARCDVLREGTKVQTGITPMTVSVEKSRRNISVSCVDGAGRQGVATSKSGMEPWFFGNVMLGGLIGMSIDVLDGAVNKYDSPVWVSLGDATPQPPVALDRLQPALASRSVSIVTAASATISPISPNTPGHRAFLVRAAGVDEATSISLRMNAPRGVVLLDVVAGGAAASSGLLPGDVVLAFDDVPVTDVADLSRDLNQVPLGGQARVTIWRNDAERSLIIRL
jgi:hypothetical protein